MTNRVNPRSEIVRVVLPGFIWHGRNRTTVRQEPPHAVDCRLGLYQVWYPGQAAADKKRKCPTICRAFSFAQLYSWWARQGSNLRPTGYELARKRPPRPAGVHFVRKKPPESSPKYAAGWYQPPGLVSGLVSDSSCFQIHSPMGWALAT